MRNVTGGMVMPAKSKMKKSSKQVYIICAIAVAVVLCVVFGVHKYKLSQVAPVYQLKVDGLEATTPAEAQAACRADYRRFADAMEKYTDCAWVWTGKKTLYLVKPEALEVDASAEETGFTAVKFLNSKGKELSGYIIDPATEPVELGRIKISDAEEYTFDNVSMTIRVGLRSGDISYENAVYLWEKDTDIVLAVRPDTYKTVEGSIVSFTDDGNVTHTCYVLDTEI
jgi:hypothetical protein